MNCLECSGIGYVRCDDGDGHGSDVKCTCQTKGESMIVTKMLCKHLKKKQTWTKSMCELCSVRNRNTCKLTEGDKNGTDKRNS